MYHLKHGYDFSVCGLYNQHDLAGHGYSWSGASLGFYIPHGISFVNVQVKDICKRCLKFAGYGRLL